MFDLISDSKMGHSKPKNGNVWKIKDLSPHPPKTKRKN